MKISSMVRAKSSFMKVDDRILFVFKFFILSSQESDTHAQ